MKTSPHLADTFSKFQLSPLNATAAISNKEIVSLSPRRKHVCIYGNGFGKERAPLLDPDVEVWAINLIPPVDSFGRVRADRWFDLHQRCAQTQDDLRWIAACPFPIYVPPDLLDASPNAVAYPLDAIEELFKAPYWACTFAYQIALAMFEGFEKISLFGVELAYGTKRERTVEFANVAYWVGRAEHHGIEVFGPRDEVSMLARHPARYGFEYVEEKTAVESYVKSIDYYDRARKTVDAENVSIGG